MEPNFRPEILRMSELNDSSELQLYSAAVLYVMSAVHCPPEYIQVILDHYVNALRSSTVRTPFSHLHIGH
jgi:proteasome activator subunit 4